MLSDASAPTRLKPTLIVRVVAFCVAHAWIVVTAVILLCVAMTRYVNAHFAMTTDTYALLSPKLPWRVRQAEFNAAFPPESSDIVVVVDGQTPELSEAAAASLAAGLSTQSNLFRSVERPDGGPFWAHKGLLFASVEDVRTTTSHLLKNQPLLGSMASDPSLRGLANTLALAMKGIKEDHGSIEPLHTPLRTLADALQALAAGKPQFFSWRTLITGQKADETALRHILLVNPVLDFKRLQPAKLPIDAIRRSAQLLQLDAPHGVRVRLTGSVPLLDEEFATLAERAGLIASLASAAIILMLWFAVRSPWLIASILATTVVGLLMATALGLALFHRFNIISVAFIPLFVGMGMDLGIQFSVRYRAERPMARDVPTALIATGRTMGMSLTLAAAAIGAGFLAFAPTSYYGVSQLGVIAGLGLIAALALNLTVLPALIALTRPPGAPVGAGARLALIDNYVLGHRGLVVGTGAVAALICAALLPLVRFDFNPIHLRSSRAESVATLLDLMREEDRSPNTLEVIRPDLAAADQLAAVFRRDPTVHAAHTLSTFIPSAQPEKIALIDDAANIVDITLNPLDVPTPPTDAEIVDSLGQAALRLRETSIDDPTLHRDARRLADEFDALAHGNRAIRARAEQMLIPGFNTTLEQIRNFLHPGGPVSLETLPGELVRRWETPDRRARVSVLPEGDSNDDAVLRRFVAAGIRIAPDATGTAVYLQAYGKAVVDAFIEAGVLSFIAICALLLYALRRVRDVAITMAPIVLTGLLTMGTCVVIAQPLNFANIIALPLLFGIGVAFHIYFVMSWRSGGSHLLTSSLARGVFFSALATATGFGSLWASSHPGTASMGELLMISLVWTLTSALLFQPALMGPAKVDDKRPAPTS
jgi:uncharacterized protein